MRYIGALSYRPEELVDAGLGEGAAQRGELELLGVDDGHGGVPEPAQLQRLFHARLRTRLGPHPSAHAPFTLER
jgi:hypothetical protein